MKFKAYLWSLLTVVALSFAAASCSDDDDNVVPPTPEKEPVITLTPASQEVVAEGGDFTFAFTVKNATNAKATAKADAAWVKNVAVKDAQVAFTVEANEGEARKATITVSYAGAKDAKFALSQAGKGGEQQPEGPAADGKVKELTPEQFVKWIYDVKNDTKKENFLGQLPAVIDFYGPGCGEHLVPIFDHMAAEFKGQIDFFRFNFTTPEAKEIKNYMGVTMCPTLGFMKKGMAPKMVGEEEANAITTDDLMKAAIKKYLGIGGGSTPEPDPSTNPAIELKAYAGDPNGEHKASMITFDGVCTSANCKEAGVSILLTEAYEQTLKENNLTMEQFMTEIWKDPQMMNMFTPDWLAEFNGKGLQLSVNQVPASTTFSVLLDARTAEGDRAVLRRDATTDDAVSEQISQNLVKLSDKDFREKVWDYQTGEWKYKGEKPCVIDFFATWCGPCKQFAPTFKKLAKEYDGKVFFYQVDVDECTAAFQAAAILGGNQQGGIPFFCFAPMSGAPFFKVGGSSEASFRQMLDTYCLGGTRANVQIPFKVGESSVANVRISYSDALVQVK